VGIYPRICKKCGHRSHSPKWEHLVLVVLFSVTGAFVVGNSFLYYRAHHKAKEQPPSEPNKIVLQMPEAEGDDSNAALHLRVGEVIGNDDVIRLVQAHLSSPLIIRLISRSAYSFQIDTQSLIALKKAGTPDDVMGAIIDLTLSSPAGKAKRLDGVTASWKTDNLKPYKQ
jgi:hypothetical protein